MGIGGGIISRKILLAVFLIASLSMTGIAGVSAADTEMAKKTTSNTNTLNENINNQSESEINYENSAKTQKTADNSTKIVQKANPSKSKSTHFRNSTEVNKTETKKTRTIHRTNHNSIKYHKKIQNSTDTPVTESTTVPKTVTQQVSSDNSVTESTILFQKQ